MKEYLLSTATITRLAWSYVKRNEIKGRTQ